MFRACPDRKHSYAELFRVGSSSADGDGAAEVVAQAAMSLELMDSEPRGAWGESPGPEVEDEYVTPPEHAAIRRKRGSSSGEGRPRRRRKPQSRFETTNKYDALSRDVFLLQEVHLRDEEDVSAFTREWVWGHLGGRWGSTPDGGEGLGRERRGGLLRKGFRGGGRLWLTDARSRDVHRGRWYTWRNSRGFASRLDYIFRWEGDRWYEVCSSSLVGRRTTTCYRSLPTDGPKWGSGFWRLNTLLLEAEAFKAVFTPFYRSAGYAANVCISDRVVGGG
ncbi:hypothetical protein AAFF_G00151530 [Aldrovandia affinis]|uniref:Uncharacterized protein n=1 Tax=Aldrovandia affinis TaxID=143900 RepID=A0AAD7R2V5_9TELE|nr:hypothetical protein AAFF_G00151530 [Aldrovandia affinis]